MSRDPYPMSDPIESLPNANWVWASHPPRSDHCNCSSCSCCTAARSRSCAEFRYAVHVHWAEVQRHRPICAAKGCREWKKGVCKGIGSHLIPLTCAHMYCSLDVAPAVPAARERAYR